MKKAETLLISQKIIPLAGAAGDSIRKAIAGVRVESDGSLVVTNGTFLFKVTPKKPQKTKLVPFTLSATGIEELKRLYGKKGVGDFILDVAATNKGPQVYFTVPGTEGPIQVNCDKVPEEFPNYLKLASKDAPKAHEHFSVSLLGKSFSIMHRLGVTGVTLNFKAPKGPSEFDANTEEFFVKALVMPMHPGTASYEYVPLTGQEPAQEKKAKKEAVPPRVAAAPKTDRSEIARKAVRTRALKKKAK